MKSIVKCVGTWHFSILFILISRMFDGTLSVLIINSYYGIVNIEVCYQELVIFKLSTLNKSSSVIIIMFRPSLRAFMQTFIYLRRESKLSLLLGLLPSNTQEHIPCLVHTAAADYYFGNHN